MRVQTPWAALASLGAGVSSGIPEGTRTAHFFTQSTSGTQRFYRIASRSSSACSDCLAFTRALMAALHVIISGARPFYRINLKGAPAPAPTAWPSHMH